MIRHIVSQLKQDVKVSEQALASLPGGGREIAGSALRKGARRL